MKLEEFFSIRFFISFEEKNRRVVKPEEIVYVVY